MPSISLWLNLALAFATPMVDDDAIPRVLDERLVFEKIVEHPRIVTPTGIAVETSGDVLVIESHTHFRPDDYAGPPADHILRVSPPKEDDTTWNVRVFFKGTRHTMNLGVHPSGAIYVATRREVFALRDTDNDGVAEEREAIATLKTSGDYPHNGLSGFAFGDDGDVYFGLGENLGADYALVGSDGTTLTGGGEGGSIYRCRPDGKGLTRVATGFWNPFHLCFDSFGRLFAVDNDPDSRPPCRLLHVVAGGDYGYRFRNGRKGLHPFTAWNGELPGTLPMVAGTGEAPSGILAYESDNLPSEYRGVLVGTSWGDHRIEIFPLRARGASFEAEAKTIVQGSENFRPVGIAQAPDGSLFVSDWVDKSYTLHGKGRLWRLRAKNPAPRLLPADPRETIGHPDRRVRTNSANAFAGLGALGVRYLSSVATTHADPRARAQALTTLSQRNAVAGGVAERLLADSAPEIASLAAERLPPAMANPLERLQQSTLPAQRAALLRRLTVPRAQGVLLANLREPDPFLRQAAREGIKTSLSLADQLSLARDNDPAVRMGILLVLRERDDESARAAIPGFLADADAEIRFAAVEWISNAHLQEYRSRVAGILKEQAITRSLFSACLATLSRLDRHPAALASDVPGEEYVAQFLLDKDTPPSVWANALRMLRSDHPSLTMDRLAKLLAEPDIDLRTEAVRTLRESPHPEKQAVLRGIAEDESQSVTLRTEAIVGLDPANDPTIRATLISLAQVGIPEIQEESLRSLRGVALAEAERTRLARTPPPRDGELLRRLLGVSRAQPPEHDDLGSWLELLEGPASAEAGERVFFHPKGPGCFRCHAIDGRGSEVGPDLSNLAKGMDRKRIVDSILRPSLEIAPRFVPWNIMLHDGTLRNGLLRDEDIEGKQTYVNSKGELFSLLKAAIAERSPSKISIMPDNLASTMTMTEFRDLLAFLSRTR